MSEVITRVLTSEEILEAIRAYHSIPAHAQILFTSKKHTAAPSSIIKQYWTMENALVTYEYRGRD